MDSHGVRILLILCSLSGLGCSSLELPRPLAREFAPESARQYVEFLASDELRGRATPSPELLRAAQYIADAFQRWGLQPVGKSYWYEYELVRRDLAPDSLFVRIRKGPASWEARIPQQAVPHSMTGAGRQENAPLILIGGERLDTAYLEGWASYLQGSVVLLIRSRRTDTMRTTGWYAPLRTIARQLRRYGVVGILLSDHPEAQRGLRPQRFPWPALSSSPLVQSLPWQLAIPDTMVPVMYSVGQEVIEAALGSIEALRERLRRADTLTHPLVEPIPDVRVDLAVAFEERERVSVPNVVALLPGRRFPGEYVLVGAHFDHVGVMASANSADSIYNGADDNASGTAGLLLMARALSQWRRAPERSIVFVAFSGEERGLLGSRAFVAAPPLPLDSCLAMVNLDMIGRNHPDSLSVGVSEEWLRRLVEQENQRLTLPFLLGQEAQRDVWGASDHAVFVSRGIPAAFFFTGLHEDYHRPSDHADRLNYDKLSRVALLAARVVWRIAQQGRKLQSMAVP